MPVVELKPEPTGEACPSAASRWSSVRPRGKFIGCQRFGPACPLQRTIRWGDKCPQCRRPVILKRTRKGGLLQLRELSPR